MIHLFLSILLISQMSFSAELRIPASEKTSAEARLISQLITCAKNEKPQEARKCSKNFISSSRSEVERDALIEWLQYPFSLSYPTPCAAEYTKYLPRMDKDQTKLYLCSDFQIEGRKRKAIFLFSEEKGKLLLHNIHERSN